MITIKQTIDKKNNYDGQEKKKAKKMYQFKPVTVHPESIQSTLSCYSLIPDWITFIFSLQNSAQFPIMTK